MANPTVSLETIKRWQAAFRRNTATCSSCSRVLQQSSLSPAKAASVQPGVHTLPCRADCSTLSIQAGQGVMLLLRLWEVAHSNTTTGQGSMLLLLPRRAVF